MQTIYTDVLVIGAGLAGERAAIEVAQAGFSAICLSLVPARRSHSVAARGGIRAAVGRRAGGPEEHFAATVRGSDWSCDQEVAKLFADLAPIETRRLAYWGTPFNRIAPLGGKNDADAGLLDVRPLGSAGQCVCYAANGIGHGALYAADNVSAKLGVEVHDRTEAIALIHDGYTCYGVVARCLRTGELNVYLARATVVASGGFGRLYLHSAAGIICDGGALAMIAETGLVPMGNMEAVQFHPLALATTDVLLPESCRTAGGQVLDVHREPLAEEGASGRTTEPERHPRDAACRRMLRRIREGGGVKGPYGDHLWLDLRNLGPENIKRKLGETAELCAALLGLDPARDLIPVRPVQRYCMGGIRTNRDGHAYGLKGLFACGEAACWDLHGFDRLDGNSLAEAVVAGGVVGRRIAEYLQGVEGTFHSAIIEAAAKKQEERIRSITFCKAGTENVFKVRRAMQEALDKGANASRTGGGLTECVASLQEILARARRVGLKSDGKGVNPELTAALRLEGQVKLALMVASGALLRTESRGSHFREDFPARNDGEWLTRTLACWKSERDDLPTLKYEPASRIIHLPPEENGAGETPVPAATEA